MELGPVQRRPLFCAAALLLSCFHTDARATEAPRSTIGPACRVDLRSVVKAEPVPTLGTRGTPWVPVITLHFLDNERFVATLVTPASPSPGVAARSSPDAASPFRLSGVVIEASTGKVLATPEWPSNVRAAGVVAANDRGFVTQIGSHLTLFSNSLVPLKRITLPPPVSSGPAYNNEWYPSAASWSGKRVLFLAGSAWTTRSWLWLDAANLEVLDSWQDAATGAIAVSDNQVVMDPSSRHFGDPPPSLMAEPPGGPWKAIPVTVGVSRPHFVGPEVLCFDRDIPDTLPPRYDAFRMTVEGTSAFGAPFREGDAGLCRGILSRTRGRVVVLQTQFKGFHPVLDIGGHSVLKGFLVFDAPFTTPSYTLRVRGSKLRNVSAALSPDGRHVAVLGYPQPVLEVFELPPIQ